MSIIIDTPEGIAFARAAARAGALHMELQGMKRRGRTVYSIVKQVYGFTGNRQTVSSMLDEYVEGTLQVRSWRPAYFDRIAAIAKEAERRVIEEKGRDGVTKDAIDSNVQAFFEAGNISEQEGNDACLLIYITVVKQFNEQAEGRRAPIEPDCDGIRNPEENA